MRVAVLSDIHGNSWALSAVLADVRRRAVDAVVNLGDSLYGPLDPAGTAGLLAGIEVVSVLGNEDVILLDTPEGHSNMETLDFTLGSLREEHLSWLAAQSRTAVALDRFLLCHGTPHSDSEYLLRRVTETCVELREAEELDKMLGAIAEEVVLCGHDHLPALVSLPGGKAVINPGSVGLPAYSDDQPYKHAMQAGSPHARYAVVTYGRKGLAAEQIALTYDWSSAAAAAGRNGRADWERWLATGRA